MVHDSTSNTPTQATSRIRPAVSDHRSDMVSPCDIRPNGISLSLFGELGRYDPCAPLKAESTLACGY